MVRLVLHHDKFKLRHHHSFNLINQNNYLCPSFNTVCSGINDFMKYSTLLYYCYSTIADAEQFAADHLIFCKSLDLTGRIIVATEGLKLVTDGELPAAGDRLESTEEQEKLKRAILLLPEAQRQVLMLRYYSNLKFVEIAQMLGIPLNTALGRMHKATQKLKVLMEQ